VLANVLAFASASYPIRSLKCIGRRNLDAKSAGPFLRRVVFATMKKYQTRRVPFDPVREMTKVTAERMKMTLELLQKLVCAYAANEKAKQRFMNVVLSRLATIEATVSSIHGIQFLHLHKDRDFIYTEKAEEDARHSSEFIARKSQELGHAMIKLIYGGLQEAESQSADASETAIGDAQRERRSRTRRPRSGL
jgi:hypothetical protein